MRLQEISSQYTVRPVHGVTLNEHLTSYSATSQEPSQLWSSKLKDPECSNVFSGQERSNWGEDTDVGFEGD